jgi:hypothetical protein
MSVDPAIWDVTALRRLLTWTNESQQREEQRVRDMTPQYRVLYHTPSVEECEALFRLEDTRR